MSVRVLCIKKAYVEDAPLAASIQYEIESFAGIVAKLFPNVDIETCAVSEDQEWLMHGRTLNPDHLFAKYEYVAVFVHNGDIYEHVRSYTEAYAKNVFYIYDMADQLFHHAERLQTLLKVHKPVDARFPHQKHVSMKEYNQNFISAEEIAGAHVRDLFLPIHTLTTSHRDHPQYLQNLSLSYTPQEFVHTIHEYRHRGDNLTFREHISGHTVFVVAIPGFRHSKIYTSIPLMQKKVEHHYVWNTIHLTKTEREAVQRTVTEVSSIAFSNQVVIYTISIHPKRGVFIQSTNPLLTFTLYNPEFFFALCLESGILPTELFVLLRKNP